MKKKLWVLLGILIALFLAVPGAAFAEEYYTTSDFKVDMVVNENHRYTITESITVTYTQPRHGIYRYIPYKGSFYREIDGVATETSYVATVSHVSVEGYPYETESEDGSYLIKIGDADSTVSGTHTYVIHYTWDPGDNGIAGFDDVYYNIIPHNWGTPIDNASFTIQMPKAFDTSQLNVYAGEYGAVDAGLISTQVNGDTISGKSTAVLPQGEGATVNLRLPEGYFVGERVPTSGIPFVYGACVIGLIAGIVLFFLYGRDKRPVEVVNFYPPHGFTPPQIGTIIDGKTDQKDLISVIMYLADKGYMTIEETAKGKFTFHRLKRPTKKEPDFIREIFDGIFPFETQTRTSESLKDTFYNSIATAKTMVELYFDEPEHQLFTSTSKTARWILLGVMVLMTLVFAAAQTYASEGYLDLLMTGVHFLFIAFPVMAFVTFYNTAIINKNSISSGKRVFRGLLWLLLSLLTLAFALGMNPLPLIVAIVAYGSLVLLGILQLMTKCRSDIGTTWLGEVRGFKNFIANAEADRIKMLVEETPSYFYNILPYAYVLGITDQWAKNFEGIAIEPPTWYYGYNTFDTFDCLLFASIMNHSMHSMTSDMIHIPSDSGSGGFGDSGFGGGGGFSGGGGGGGGGGSW